MPISERARALAGRSLPPPRWRPYALPVAAAVHEARWRARIRRAPLLTGDEHAARVGLRDIEEVIGCSLCGEPRMQLLFTPAGPNARWRYHVVRCPACGFLYRHPGIRPERLGELYAGHYDRFLTGRYGKRRRRRYRMVMRGFGTVFADGAGRRLLDFGCGVGGFLELADRRGFEAYGVDLSPAAVAHARGRPGGAHAHLGAPLDVPEIAAGGFDVVTLWSVLAHLPRPIDDLRMLRGLLAPGGVVLILTVNANSLQLKSAGAAWNGFTPNHLKFFSPSTLARALALAGFERPSMPPLASYATIERGNRANMLRALAFRSDPAVPAQPAAANASA